MVGELTEHTQLAVGLKSGEHATGVMVVEKFTSKLEVELVAELSYAFFDVARLYRHVFFIVESVSHNGTQI
jgi:hypothetical protein